VNGNAFRSSGKFEALLQWDLVISIKEMEWQLNFGAR
jgi:hypothetical protein